MKRRRPDQFTGEFGPQRNESPRYLYQYAKHAAWLEDHRHRSNGGNAGALIGLIMHHPVSQWAGHWRRAA